LWSIPHPWLPSWTHQHVRIVVSWLMMPTTDVASARESTVNEMRQKWIETVIEKQDNHQICGW
jgi:hypothetical protein